MATREDELALKDLLLLVMVNDNFDNLVKLFANVNAKEELKKMQDKIEATVSCDEVYRNVFIGNMGAAKNLKSLKERGITHVVNMAEGKHMSQVDTNEEYYRDASITYLGLSLLDESATDISVHFYQVADFVEEALKGGGKVLVHCMMGVSRSATCVLAYLMIKQGMSAAEAVKQVRQHRYVCPNEGFLRQLIQLDNKLSAGRCGKGQDA